MKTLKLIIRECWESYPLSTWKKIALCIGAPLALLLLCGLAEYLCPTI